MSQPTVNPDTQVKAHEVGVKVTDQVIAIQNHMATVANMFLVVTGALWAAIGAKGSEVTSSTWVAILAIHIVACIAVLQHFVSNVNAILLRFKFLTPYGEKWYPDIEARVVSYKNQEARTLRIWDGNSQQPITQEVFSP